MRSPITYKELFEQYTDLEDTFLLENMRIEIQEGKAKDETTVYISETTDTDLDKKGLLWDTEGADPWQYIPNRTFTLSDETNSFTIGYVYSELKQENLCPDCKVYCEKRFVDGRCE